MDEFGTKLYRRVPVRRRLAGPIAAILVLSASMSVSAQLDWSQLQPGHWYEIPNSDLRPLAPDPHPGGGGFGNIMAAWSGGAYDTNRDLLIIWGGGHGDYAGNEIYGFDVNTLEWRMISGPSYNVGGDKDSGFYPDGTPRSRHTYNYIQYVPSIDRFCSLGDHAMFPNGTTSTPHVNCNDFDWKTVNPSDPKRGWEYVGDLPRRGRRGPSAYDPVTGHIWLHGRDEYLLEWDPVANVWTDRTTSGELVASSRHTAALDPGRRVFVEAGDGSVSYVNIDGPGLLTEVRMSTSGPQTIENEPERPGFVFDPVSDQFIGWNGGTSVYALDFDTATWKQCTPAAGNSVSPGSAANWGTYGRFQYIPSKNAFIVVNSVDTNVFVYRLSPQCGGGPPDTTAPSTPQGLGSTGQSASTIDLGWSPSADPETGVSFYRVYRNGSEIAQSNITSYTDTMLSDGTTYSYTVSAVNAAGLESTPSAAVQVSTQQDTTPPTLASAEGVSNPPRVIVTFSEPVSSASATNPSNYSIDNGVSVSSASLAADLVTATLTTSPLSENVTYTLTVNNVQDRATSPNTIASNTSMPFEFAYLVTLDLRIDAGVDDVEEEQDGSVGSTSADLEMVLNGTDHQTVGLRFRSLPIPQGATIVNAYVQFTADGTTSTATSLQVQGHAVDNAPAFTSAIGNVTSRSLTTGSAGWVPPTWNTGDSGPDQRSPDVSMVIQEIVNRPGWTSGNALVLIVSGSGTRRSESYDGNSLAAPLLHVEFTSSPPTDPPPPPGTIQVE